MFGYISPPDFYLISIARRSWSTSHHENCLMLVFPPTLFGFWGGRIFSVIYLRRAQCTFFSNKS